MNDLIEKKLKDHAKHTELPQGFDQRFYQKLNQIKEVKNPTIKKDTLWETLFSYFAPLGMAGTLGAFIVFWSLTGPAALDWEGRAQVLNNLQNNEIQELSTLSDSDWDQLLDAAEGSI